MPRALLQILVLASVLLISALANAQQERPANIQGGISVSTVGFNPINPTANTIIFNNGLAFSLYGLKALGNSGFHLVGAIQYKKSNGTLNYNYISPSGVNYQASKVNFAFDNLDVQLGLRLKFLENSGIRPFIEGGVNGGFTQFTYDNTLKTAAIVAAGSDYRSSDSALDFGMYSSFGIELQLTHSICLTPAVKYEHNSTRAVPTLGNLSLTYDTLIYGGGLDFKF